MNIKVKNCQECPFIRYHAEYFVDTCIISDNISLDDTLTLPADGVHDLCPLKKESVTVELAKEK